ncbi:MAG: hypothetical protein AAFU64_07035, partial [Bacteroidota bacterium]
MKKILLLFITVLHIAPIIQAQSPLLESRQSSYYTYVYRLDNKQALSLLKKEYIPWVEDYLTSRPDSFPSDSLYKKELPRGHYLFVKAVRGQLTYRLETKENYRVEILNNQRDLRIIVLDTLGQEIKDAQIRLKNRRIPYDPKSGTYCMPKTNHQGILKVNYQGVETYYEIERRYNNSRFKRIKNKVLYNRVSYYALYPVHKVYGFFRESYQAIKYRRAPRYYERLRNLFTGDRISRSYNYKYKGFITFNKPQYRPGDSLQIKSPAK